MHGLQETSQEPWCPPGVPTQVPTPLIPGDRPRVRLGQWAGGCPGEVQPHCGRTGRRPQGGLQDSCSSSARTVLWPSQGHVTVHWEPGRMPGGKERVAGTREAAAWTPTRSTWGRGRGPVSGGGIREGPPEKLAFEQMPGSGGEPGRALRTGHSQCNGPRPESPPVVRTVRG